MPAGPAQLCTVQSCNLYCQGVMGIAGFLAEHNWLPWYQLLHQLLQRTCSSGTFVQQCTLTVCVMPAVRKLAEWLQLWLAGNVL